MTKIYLVRDRPWRIDEHDAKISEDGIAIAPYGSTSIKCKPGTYARSRKQAREDAVDMITQKLIRKLDELNCLIELLTTCEQEIKELANAQQRFLPKRK